MSRDVLLLVEHRDGVPDPVLYPLIAQARALAAACGGRVSGLVLGTGQAEVAKHLARAGLDLIHLVGHELLSDYNPEAFGKGAAEAVRVLEPGLFLCAHTFQGMEVAPFVAATLSVPLLPNCVELSVDGDDLVAERLVFGQSWQACLRVTWQGTVVASMARSSAPSPNDVGETGTPIQPLELDIASLGIRTGVVAVTSPPEGDVDISRAEVVVGVGRGIRDSSNLAVVEELAQALGGVLACSRPLVDLEWMPHDRQVGVSGKTIRPKLYIACGISGAAQHLAGMSEAEMVVAINQDANAPIFRVAHYGIVADLFRVVPALAAEARRRRGREGGRATP